MLVFSKIWCINPDKVRNIKVIAVYLVDVREYYLFLNFIYYKKIGDSNVFRVSFN